MQPFQFSSINYRSQGSIDSRSPSGAEATDYLTMDHGETQSPLAAVVGGFNIRPVQEDEQTVTEFEKAALQVVLDLEPKAPYRMMN